MPIRLDVFDDFHLRGASAPEWDQRYAQISPGAMRSSLVEAAAGDVHVFRKWMSGRVVQQGCVPAGRICFALLQGCPGGMPRMQGQELRDDRVFILRGGEEFTIHRPHGMELLALTLQAEALRRLLDERPWRLPARQMLSRHVVQVPRPALQALRERLLLTLQCGSRSSSNDLAASNGIVESMRLLFEQAGGVRESVASASAGFIVAECHRIVMDSGDEPPDVEALCLRMRISRRSLQNGFRQVADTTATHYLRSVRLDMVRRRLMSQPADSLSVSQAASDQGFVHLSHFTERYKALFGELPSQTARSSRGA